MSLKELPTPSTLNNQHLALIARFPVAGEAKLRAEISHRSRLLPDDLFVATDAAENNHRAATKRVTTHRT